MSRRAITRRHLLQQTGYLLAAAAAFPRTLIAADPVSPTMSRLSAYMAGAVTRPLPPAALEQTKLHVLDTFASMISGSVLPPGRAGIAFARTMAAAPTATVAASTVTTGAIDAALANGMLAQADETDDSHGPSQSHPGCAVVPAALAAGEQFGISGAHFLRAVALGYDVGPRVTMAMGGARFRTGSHKATHAIAGTFGAAAAAGAAAGLDERQMRWLLDYAAQQSSGIGAWERDVDHIEKAFVFAGMTARNGVTAALLVRAGWNGVDDVFSGADNFFLAYAPDAQIPMLTEQLGERFEVTRTDIKKWTVGSPIQSPLDALQAILKRRPIQPAQVAQVRVRLAPTVGAVVDNRDSPDLCLQHMVAVMLLDGTASFAAAHDKARMRDTTVLRERAKVHLVGDESLNPLLPQRVAIVEVDLTDGTTLRERVDAVRGTAANPMSRAEVVEKARDLVVPLLGGVTGNRLIDTVLMLDTVDSVRALRPMLQRLDG